MAALLLALWRARRLGRPVAEPVPVELAGSELTAAVGDLMARGHRREAAAAGLRDGVRRALGRAGAAEPQALEPLTDREQEILRMIGEGLTNREIADALVLSLNTVKSHRLRVYQKLGLHTRAELGTFMSKPGISRSSPSCGMVTPFPSWHHETE